jgi:hypothetical protein
LNAGRRRAGNQHSIIIEGELACRRSKTSVLHTLGPPQSRLSYEHAMEKFIAWYCAEPRLALNRVAVLCYRIHLCSKCRVYSLLHFG